MMLTKSILDLIVSRGAKEKNILLLLEALKKWLPIYLMDTDLRLAAFLSQCAYETGGFIFFKELGGQDYFKKYEGDTKIGKMLGNTQPGDGYKYKGRGPLQITGRSNYEHYGKLINENLIDDPDLLLIPDIGVHCACEFWKQHDLNTLSDNGNIREITKRINGGLNGLDERVNNYNVLIKALHVNGK
jgi:putative chitinase